jgi:hypothetical protein
MLEKLKQKMEKLRDAGEEAAVNLLTEKVSPEIQQHRYNTCLNCEKLYKPTNTCKACGCFMKVKTWIPVVNCPLNKWGPSPADKES